MLEEVFKCGVVILMLECACFFWRMLLFSPVDQNRELKVIWSKGGLRDSRQLFLEEEMGSKSLQPHFTLHVSIEKNSLKMLSECLPGRGVLGCKERASKVLACH